MSNKRDIAEDVWRLMSEFSRRQMQEKGAELRALGLTPGHMRALLALQPGAPRPIGSCAIEIGCDASTATWLIDRLEEKGLAERRPSSSDRRVKEVVLTPLGVETKAELQSRWEEPPEELLRLSRDELESLRDAFSRLASRYEASREAVRRSG
ncbi:MAG: MarR family transcriptional regulator [Actinomycetota bacterium]|nr:MarR family transcriptional regulator [Actinomycetota bacterium]